MHNFLDVYLLPETFNRLHQFGYIVFSLNCQRRPASMSLDSLQ